MSNTIGRSGLVLGEALWQNLEFSSSWHESVGKNGGAERSGCPVGDAEEVLVDRLEFWWHSGWTCLVKLPVSGIGWR